MEVREIWKSARLSIGFGGNVMKETEGKLVKQHIYYKRYYMMCVCVCLKEFIK